MIHNPSPTSRLTAYQLWGGLIAFLVIAFFFRFPYLPVPGHADLIHYNIPWAEAIRQDGLFSVYANQSTCNYPPIYLFMLAVLAPLLNSTAESLSLLKLVPVLSDLMLIVILYRWIPSESRFKWALPGLVTFYPGLIVTSAFWGQIDSFLCLLCALVLLNMNLRRPRAAWLLFTLALLTKFQAVVLLPLLLVLTLRRHGWRTVGQGVALCGVVFVCVVLPFVFGSGLQNALRPFFQAVDLYPTTTVNAFNLWHVVNPSVWGSRPPLLFQDISDSVPIVASLTPKMLGLLLLGLYTILVCIVVWKQAGKPREFIWGAAMSFGFFMLPTEIHERYLQIAVVLTLFAVVQDSRMLVVTLGLLFTYSYNVIVPTHAPFEWLGVNLLFEVGDISLAAALFNVLLFIWTIRILLDDVPIRWSQGLRVLLASAGSLLLLAVFVSVLVPDSLPASAKRLDIRLGDSKRLEGYSLKKDEDVWTLTLYWQALAFDNVDYTLFVHTIKDGAKVSQRDERPQDGAYPTWRWYNNRLVPTALVIELPPGTRPDTLLTGLYEAGKMVNVPVVQNGQSVPDGRAVLCSGDC